MSNACPVSSITGGHPNFVRVVPVGHNDGGKWYIGPHPCPAIIGGWVEAALHDSACPPCSQ
jgi:hypothetical protein